MFMQQPTPPSCSVMPWAGSTMYAACRGALHTLAAAVRADINAVRGRECSTCATAPPPRMKCRRARARMQAPTCA